MCSFRRTNRALKTKRRYKAFSVAKVLGLGLSCSAFVPSSLIAYKKIGRHDTYHVCEPHLLLSKDIDPEYDAILIGSGQSGLCAGNYIANQGRKVLMLESHSIPGGYTSSFRRNGFCFPVSTHILNGCHPDGSIGKILQYFNVYDKIEFTPIKHMFRWIDTERQIDAHLPVGIDAYVEKLCSMYPHEEKGIREFHERYYPLAEWVLEYEKCKGLTQMVHILKDLPILFRLLSLKRKTASDLIDPLIKDPACRELVTVLTSLFGLHYTELDAAVYVMGSLMFHADGAYYPKGGSAELTRVLANHFTELGGDLHLETHVDGIQFDENGIATGVRVKGKEGKAKYHSANCVINCSDLSNLVNKLCPKGTLPNHFVKNVQKHVPGRSLVVAWAGLDIDLRDLGITDFEIIRTNNIADQMNDSGLLDEITRNADYSNLPVSGITIYSNIDPSCCEPGKSVISTNFMASYDTFVKFSEPDGGKGAAYHDLKNQIKMQLLKHMTKATGVQDLADHVEVLEVATPLTLQRYTENSAGSYMGWSPIPSQGAFSSFSPRTPVRNLFQCGQWLGIGGVATAMTSGVDAAKMAVRYMNRLDKSSQSEERSHVDSAVSTSFSIHGSSG